MNRPMRQNLLDLACSLYAGSTALEDIQIVIPGDQIQDAAHAKWRVQQVLDEKHVKVHEVYLAVKQYIERAEVPGVVQWEAK